ncbi:putative Sucraseferredoxin-like [Cocos nucifera]|uniref:Putative Sucraseferredoxin-like n=1 Tax=Cocos nucifera TaxID=13894 RepID=A0A8K0HUF0_COCNU|nr:putative Sucraseferredoxin-like [Cocos nucifera]
MGLSEEDQKNAHKLRLQLNGGMEQNTAREFVETTGIDGAVNGSVVGGGGCCQGTGNINCCQNMPRKEKPENDEIGKQRTRDIGQKKSNEEPKASSSKAASCTRKICPMPTWFESWEREDTYAALAVVAAIASVAVAYSCYRQMR